MDSTASILSRYRHFVTEQESNRPLHVGALGMKKPEKQQLWLAVSCLVCVIVALRNTNSLEGTEFSGGWLTGPLLSMIDIGTVLFVLALIVTFMFPRIAGAIGLASSLLCLPLYLYFIAPVTLQPDLWFRASVQRSTERRLPLGQMADRGSPHPSGYHICLSSRLRSHYTDAYPGSRIIGL
jgi:hypothetical protein